MTKPLAMVIEDDYDASAIMKEALTAAGYDVTTIRDGETASLELALQVPHLIALDLHLPGIDGDSLLKQIRSDNRFDQTQVMLVTADDRQAYFLNESANLVLLKPVSYSQLERLARRLLPK